MEMMVEMACSTYESIGSSVLHKEMPLRQMVFGGSLRH
jgi:hypothetical protein